MKTSTGTTKSTEGIALIATILILAMCFASLLSVLSLTSLSLKRGGKTQYHGYQALLAAESGVNSFVVRSTPTLFDTSQSELTLSALNTWLELHNLSELNLLNSTHTIQNTLQFSNLTPQSATLESVGTVHTLTESGEPQVLAKKVLRVDFKLHAVGSQLSMQPSAALTTLGKLTLEGNASLTGASASTISGIIRNYDQAKSLPTPLPNTNNVQLRVQHPNRFHTGQYLALSSRNYRITTVDRNANALELLPLPSSSSEAINDVEIALIPVALATEVVTGNSPTSQLPINSSKTAMLAVGQSVSIAGYGTDYGAIIETINENNISIKWTTTIPQQNLPEGSIIALGIMSARSAHAISTSASNSLASGQEENANLTTTNLFEESFGLSKDDLLGPLNSYNQRSGKSFSLEGSNALYALSKLEGLYYTEDNLSFDTTTPLCGSALVIAAADVSISSVCDEGFSGLLYVFGSFTHTGGHIEGAVISEEGRTLAESESTQTQLSGQASINYNADALTGWLPYLQDSLATQDGKQNFQQVSGSWRLE